MAQEALIPPHLIKQEPVEFCQLVCTDCLQEETIDVYSNSNTTPYRCWKCENEEDDGQREKQQWAEAGSIDCNRTSSSTCMDLDEIFYSDEDDASEEEEQREGSVGSVGSAPSTSYMTVTTHIEVYTLYYYKQ